MLSQLMFLPSIMLSGIMFPSFLPPRFLQYISYVFPATLGFKAMTEFQGRYLLFLPGILFVMSLLSAFRPKRISEK
jgi:pltK